MIKRVLNYAFGAAGADRRAAAGVEHSGLGPGGQPERAVCRAADAGAACRHAGRRAGAGQRQRHKQLDTEQAVQTDAGDASCRRRAA